MKEAVTYTHENGYSAVLYGISSMNVYHKGKKVMHTVFRSVNTEAEVMELLGKLPNLMKQLSMVV